jgi:hypothetical protein
MGGGQNSAPPVDLLGGQYASFTGGTPSGVNWSGAFQDLGKGIGQAGQAYAAGVPSALPRAAGSDQISQPFQIPVSGQQQSYPLIPTNKQENGDQGQMIMQLLQQLLGGSGGSY